jgi:hypothetical protein
VICESCHKGVNFRTNGLCVDCSPEAKEALDAILSNGSDRDKLAADNARLRSLNAELLAMLSDLQWADYDEAFQAPKCSVCRGINPTFVRYPGSSKSGHAEKCDLATLIARAKQEAPS